jgi:hypothetical protein
MRHVTGISQRLAEWKMPRFANKVSNHLQKFVEAGGQVPRPTFSRSCVRDNFFSIV